MKIVKFIFALTFALSLLVFTSNCSKGSSPAPPASTASTASPASAAYNNCLEQVA